MTTPVFSAVNFKYGIHTIPLEFEKRMKGYTWRPQCPVPIKNLRYVNLSYWGYDKQVHNGVLILHKDVSREVVSIFKILFMHKFPIERMEPMESDAYKGNDDLALEANDTVAFNCRPVTGKTGVYSQHSYGRTIDINMKVNPYVKDNLVLPPSGKAFVDRNVSYLGKITREGIVYKIFTKHGWEWGGNWHDLKDYMHFEKNFKIE